MQTLSNIIASVLGESEDRITEDASPKTLQRWDSLRHVSLVMALEDEFGIIFSSSEIVSLRSVGGIRQALLTKGVIFN